MKRQILTIAAVLALVFAGAVFAQSPQNTTAPGPTTQQEPGLTNNNLPNPGHPVPDPTAAPNQPTEAQGTATQTGMPLATEPAPQTTTTTETTTTEPAPQTTTETTTTETTTGTETETTSSAGTYGNENAALPSTASDLPTVALLGLLALGAAFVLRLSKRNA